MSNAQNSGNGGSSGDEADADAWKASLMRRTEEVSHVQAQTTPVPSQRFDPFEGMEPVPPEAPAPLDLGAAAPAPGVTASVPGAAAVKGAPGAEPAQPRKAVQAPPPPPPDRPLASALSLASAACALVAAVLLVLPELQHARQEAPAEADAAAPREEKTLAPRFDSSAPVPEGQVREQQDTIRGASVLMVESEPSGATVTVDGVKQGTTPLSVMPICNPGNPLRVKLVRKGYETLEHATVCREDTMTQLTARLRKARGGR
jgi:hypothetical protein